MKQNSFKRTRVMLFTYMCVNMLLISCTGEGGNTNTPGKENPEDFFKKDTTQTKKNPPGRTDKYFYDYNNYYFVTVGVPGTVAEAVKIRGILTRAKINYYRKWYKGKWIVVSNVHATQKDAEDEMERVRDMLERNMKKLALTKIPEILVFTPDLPQKTP